MLVFFAKYYLGHLKPEELLISFDVCYTLSFFSQLCLCCIFWHLSKREPQPPQATAVEEERIEQETENNDDTLHSIPDVITEDFDERCDLQARIWN